MSIPQRPVQTNINNDVLNTRSAMPNKSINSINENSFSMSRVLYSNTINTLNQQTQNDLQYKKFYGEKNRDASSIIDRKKYLAQGSKNHQEVPISFQGKSSNTESRQALSRVRNGGSIVPAKKTGRIALF